MFIIIIYYYIEEYSLVGGIYTVFADVNVFSGQHILYIIASTVLRFSGIII